MHGRDGARPLRRRGLGRVRRRDSRPGGSRQGDAAAAERERLRLRVLGKGLLRRDLLPLRHGVRRRGGRLGSRGGRSDGSGRRRHGCRRGQRRSLDRRCGGRRLRGRGCGGRICGRRRRRDRLGRWDNGRGRRHRHGRSRERQHREGVEVALRVGRHAEAQMDVRPGHLRHAARPDRPDKGAFLDDDAFEHANCAQVRERDGIAVGGLDRHGAAARGHRARKGHRPGRGREHDGVRRSAHVDPPVLTAGVRVFAERERAQHGPGSRPRPRLRRRGEREQGERAGAGESSHLSSSLSE